MTRKMLQLKLKELLSGDEANIFAGDLFRMYSRFAVNKGWEIELLNAMHGVVGGFELN